MRNSTTRLMVTTLALASLALLLMPSGSSPADDTNSARALEGVWSGARFDEGKGEDPSKGVKLELTFTGDRVKARRLPEGDIGEGTFKLSADGKTMDAFGAGARYKNKTYFGIIKIEGDTLYWCTTGTGGKAPRPTEFAADPDAQTYLIVVKRQKP